MLRRWRLAAAPAKETLVMILHAEVVDLHGGIKTGGVDTQDGGGLDYAGRWWRL